MGTLRGSLSQSERHLYYTVGCPENENILSLILFTA